MSVDAGIGMWSKRLELLRAAAPKTAKAGSLGSRATWDGPYGAALREAAQGVGLSLVGAPLAAPFQEADYRRVLAAAVQEGAQALVVSDMPLPPGRARLGTMPYSIGKPKIPTIGIVLVAALKSSTKKGEKATIRSGFRLTIWRARSG